MRMSRNLRLQPKTKEGLEALLSATVQKDSMPFSAYTRKEKEVMCHG